MERLVQDLRFTLRQFRHRPTATLVTLMTLALAIGVNTAVYSLFAGVVLRPLPVEHPDRVVALWETHEGRGGWPVAPHNFFAWQQRARSFSVLALVQQDAINFTGAGEPEQVDGVRVSAGFFDLLGVEPARGRAFRSGDDVPGAAPAVVLAYDFWQRRFGGGEDSLGRTLTLDGAPHAVIGIAPPSFELPFPGAAAADLWVPLVLSEEDRRSRRHTFAALARLAPAATLDGARAEIAGVASLLARESPDSNAGWGVELVPLHEQVVGGAGRTLALLLIAVAIVLLVACANVSGLLLARSIARRRELALRLALGASRGRIVRQVLTESVVLAVVGGALGLLLASISTRFLEAVTGGGIPRLGSVEVDLQVLGFTLAIAIAAGVLFGAAPALEALRSSQWNQLSAGGRSATSGGRPRLRGALVAVESALIVVLLVGAALMVRSLHNLTRIDPGFATAERVVVELALPETAYPGPPDIGSVVDRLVTSVGTVPGVAGVAAATTLPLDAAGLVLPVLVEGAPPPKPGEEPVADFFGVTPGYFEAMGIPLLAGRVFGDGDRRGSPGVVVVTAALAQRFFPGEDPLGRRVRLFPQGPPMTVVGVVGDVRRRLDAAAGPALFHPHDQLPLPYRSARLVVSSAVEPAEALLPSIREAVRSVDSDLPIASMQSMDRAVAASYSRSSSRARLLFLFASLALCLGAVGIYGMVSFSVSQSVREIAIRQALGAGRREVLGWALRRGLAPVMVGVALGVGLALLTARSLAAWLFEVEATDPVILVATASLLLAVALFASFWPARRAASVDPASSLRRN